MKWQLISPDKSKTIVETPFGFRNQQWQTCRQGENQQQLCWLPHKNLLRSKDDQGVEQNCMIRSFRVQAPSDDPGLVSVEFRSPNNPTLQTGQLQIEAFLPGITNSARSQKSKSKNIKAPMTGKILKLNVKTGQAIQNGDCLCVIEAMKMENQIFANQDGTIKAIQVKVGDNVTNGKVIMTME